MTSSANGFCDAQRQAGHHRALQVIGPSLLLSAEETKARTGERKVQSGGIGTEPAISQLCPEFSHLLNSTVRKAEMGGWEGWGERDRARTSTHNPIA